MTDAPPPVTTDSPPPGSTLRINEDWAATAVGLILLLLVITGIIVKGMIP